MSSQIVSRRILLRFGALAGAAGLAPSLGACVTDDLGTGPALPEKQSALDVMPVLLVATTRKPVGSPPRAPYFSSDRGRGLSFAEVRLSPPDRSLLGKVSSVITGDWTIGAVPKSETGPGAAEALSQAARGRPGLI